MLDEYSTAYSSQSASHDSYLSRFTPLSTSLNSDQLGQWNKTTFTRLNCISSSGSNTMTSVNAECHLNSVLTDLVGAWSQLLSSLMLWDLCEWENPACNTDLSTSAPAPGTPLGLSYPEHCTGARERPREERRDLHYVISCIIQT